MMSRRSEIRCVCLLALCWSVPLAYAGKAALPDNPIELPFEEVANAESWLPQGWGFFTRDAQEPWREVYLRASTGWQPDRAAQSDRLKSLAGLRRSPRRQALELAALTEVAWGAYATGCATHPSQCLDGLEPIPVENRFPGATICGDVGVVERAPVPYEWREFENVEMPSTVIRLEVRCGHA